MFVLKEMLPSYHKWRYNSHGVREQIGKNSTGREGLGNFWLLKIFFLSLSGIRVITQGHNIALSFLEYRLPHPGADSCYTEPVPRDRPAQQVMRGWLLELGAHQGKTWAVAM
jgi:hypothetical protein